MTIVTLLLSNPAIMGTICHSWWKVEPNDMPKPTGVVLPPLGQLLWAHSFCFLMSSSQSGRSWQRLQSAWGCCEVSEGLSFLPLTLSPEACRGWKAWSTGDRLLYKSDSMDWMSVFLQNSYGEVLAPNVIVFRDGASEIYLGLGEVMRVYPAWWD